MMTKEWRYVLSAQQCEFIRLDSIKAETEIAANYRSLAAGFLKLELFDLAQQATRYAEYYERSVKALQEDCQ
jgi:hypothetical protein